ncbi:MAG: DUF2238 domain-containing protein [Planctomycetota bacterium]|jgi:uncharacterized membrane protein YjdF
MLLNRREWPVAVFGAIYVPGFTWMALRGRNYEFVLYGLVVIVVAAWVILKQRQTRFPLLFLWGLALWGLLHMAGGNVWIGGTKLYDLTLISIVGAPYHILGYDQVVHFIGFGVATCVCFHLLRRQLAEPHSRPRGTSMSILVVLMGLGVGTVNELLEFLAVIVMPETGVGGYENTLMDMVFNLLGAVTALIFLRSAACDVES